MHPGGSGGPLWSKIVSPGYEQVIIPQGSDLYITNVSLQGSINAPEANRAILRFSFTEKPADPSQEGGGVVEIILCTLTSYLAEQVPLSLWLTAGERATFKVEGSNSVALIGNYLRREVGSQQHANTMPVMQTFGGALETALGQEVESQQYANAMPIMQTLPRENGLYVDSGPVPALPTILQDQHSSLIPLATSEEAILSMKSIPIHRKREIVEVEDAASDGSSSTIKHHGSRSLPKRAKQDLRRSQSRVGDKATVDPLPIKQEPCEPVLSVRLGKQREGNSGIQGLSGASSHTNAVSISNSGDAPTTITNVTEVVIKDHATGHGRVSVADGDIITITLMGTLVGGQIFAQTKEGESFTFTVGRSSFVKGLDKGVIGMRAGGERSIIVPSSLAFGSVGVTMPSGIKVPADAPIHLRILLVDVQEGDKTAASP